MPDDVLGCGCEWSCGTWFPCQRAIDLGLESCGADGDPDLVDCPNCGNWVEWSEWREDMGLCRSCSLRAWAG